MYVFFIWSVLSAIDEICVLKLWQNILKFIVALLKRHDGKLVYLIVLFPGRGVKMHLIHISSQAEYLLWHPRAVTCYTFASETRSHQIREFFPHLCVCV